MNLRTKLLLAAAGVVFLLAKKSSASSHPAPRAHSVLVTDALLRQIDPRVRMSFASALAPAMAEGDITTVPRVAAFLAQVLHETAGFQFLTELASGDAYEGRKDLGNNQPGDGRRFKGRGFIQLTGRANYRAAGADLGLPLEANPDLALSPEVAASLAVWFWTRKRLNAKADAGDILGITKAINGGTNGLSERTRLYVAAKQVMDTAPVA